MKTHALALAFAPLAVLAACSPQPSSEPSAEVSATPSDAVSAAPTEAPTPEPTATPVAANVLRLEGLGDLELGKPVPKGSAWKADGVQASDTCLTYNSKAYPGVYAIVEDGAVRRITVGEGSAVKLVEGIGTGASEADVKKWFAGFREAPHTYEAAPAKYLTAPNGESGDPALRFEIDAKRKVSFIHVGTWPVLGYVEGCA